ncbi:IclR family transcriptional regulator, acetate operon repressor [Aliiglaciecola lipolytica E3]|uniref:IclR family transcriptional regulator, acetate operon repressor n=2 Tax=Aliiglaciecola TaxID=1406885 RepID=K6YYR5_9ALTE|nr:IclR family transcriptional regulator, acetate operon repressor [Aliiglaciecola lipolytica E3]
MQELMAELELPRTTLFRLLRTLCAEQMVQKRGKLYFCGAELMQLGFNIIHSDRMHQLAIPHVQRLALKSGHTAHLAVPNNGQVLIVEVFDSPNPLLVSKRPGVQAQMHCSSTGKVFLAHLYYDNLELLIQEHPMERHTEHTITDIDSLRKELKRVVAMGYALDDREYNKDARCLAVPVRDNRGVVVASIGITAPVVAFPMSQVQAIVELAKEAANGIYRDAYQVKHEKAS